MLSALLIILLVLASLPYGTVEVWWEAVLVGAILTAGGVRFGYDAFRGEPLLRAPRITLPLAVLGVFSSLQSFGIPFLVSLDAESSRLVGYQFLSFAVFVELVHRACGELKALRIFVWGVIGLGIATSLFGMLRILAFGGSGEFFLAGLKPGVGFAQFINQNHFAMLASATAGIAFMLVLSERSKQKKLLLLAAFLVPMTALVFSLSRGAIIAFVVQTAAVVLMRQWGGRAVGQERSAGQWGRRREGRESLEGLEGLESRDSKGRVRWQKFDEALEEGDQRAPEGRKHVAQGDGEAGALGTGPQYFKSPEGATEKNNESESGLKSGSHWKSESHEIDSRHRWGHDHHHPPRVRPVTRIVQFVVGITIFFSIIYGISWIGNERLAMRVEKLPDQTEVTDADRGLDRLNAWKGTWNLFKEFPIFGSGFGAFRNGITRHIEYSGHMRWEQAHSDYLEFIAAGGVVGIGVGVWLVIGAFSLYRRRLKERPARANSYRRAALIGVLGIAVHSFVEFGLHTIVNSMVLMALLSVMTVELRDDVPHR